MDLFSESRIPVAAYAVTFSELSTVGGAVILSVAYSNGWDLFQVYHTADASHIAARPEGSVVTALRPFLVSEVLSVAVCLVESPAAVKIQTHAGLLTHILRASRPVSKISSSERFIGLAGEDQLQLFAISSQFPQTFSMHVGGSIIAVGPRWVAFALPPQQQLSDPPRLTVWETAQRALDNFLSKTGDEIASGTAELRPGIVGIREAAGGAAMGSFEAHTDPIDFLKWDRSGIFILSASGRGHQVLVHKANFGQRGGCVFTLCWTLSRGVTPATISDAELLAGKAVVASARGTLHFYSLGSDSAEARVKFGAPLASESISPQVALRSSCHTIVATKTGKIESFSIGGLKAQSNCNFIRGTGEEFPRVGSFTPPGHVNSVVKTSTDFSTDEGKKPLIWHSPQLSIGKGVFKGKATTALMFECGSKIRLESSRAGPFNGIRASVGNSCVLEASLLSKLPRLGVADRKATTRSESPEGFIAI